MMYDELRNDEPLRQLVFKFIVHRLTLPRRVVNLANSFTPAIFVIRVTSLTEFCNA